MEIGPGDERLLVEVAILLVLVTHVELRVLRLLLKGEEGTALIRELLQLLVCHEGAVAAADDSLVFREQVYADRRSNDNV